MAEGGLAASVGRAEEPPRFAGMAAVVTGAAGGIGLATARLLAAEGAAVAAVDRDAVRLEAAVAGIRAAGGEARTFPADVSLRESVEAAVDGAVRAFGRIDVLVNNAGIMDGFVPVDAVDDDHWRRVLAVNLDGPMLACRRVLPLMRDQGGGAIVNVASLAGIRGGVAGAAYTASKHALVGLTRHIAWHYAPENIRCNAVCPGGVETGIEMGEVHAGGSGRLEPLIVANPRSGSPEEVARAIVFLASAAAAFVNGAVLVADAGWSAG